MIVGSARFGTAPERFFSATLGSGPGIHRWRACKKLRIDCPTTKYKGDTSTEAVAAFVFSLNRHRRYLTPTQKAAAGANLSELLADEAKMRKRAGGGHKRSPMARAKQKPLGAIGQPGRYQKPSWSMDRRTSSMVSPGPKAIATTRPSTPVLNSSFMMKKIVGEDMFP